MSQPQPAADPPLRLCIIVTSAVSLRYLYRNQFEYLASKNIEITGIASPTVDVEHFKGAPLRFVGIAMQREPSPLSDLMSFIQLWFFLLRNRFDVIHVSTPKAGLLGAMAARLSFHRNVVYTLRGRVYENMQGIKRKVFNTLEWIVCKLCKRVYVINQELADAIVAEGTCAPHKAAMIAHGSSNGIDLQQYQYDASKRLAAGELRSSLLVPEKATLILCVGRIRKEKGINEAVRAFERLSQKYQDLHLLLVGIREPIDPLESEVETLIATHPRLHELAWQADPSTCYAAADIVAFPTYREGFGNVTLEAGAMRKPIVTTDISGPRQVVEDRVNGFLVPVGDDQQLEIAIEKLVQSPRLRDSMGAAGYKNVVERFQQQLIWDGLIEEYRKLKPWSTNRESGTET